MPDPGGDRRRHRRPPALHSQPPHERALPVLETVSCIGDGHHLKGGGEFNLIDAKEGALPLHFGGRYVFRPIPALGITSSLDALRRSHSLAILQSRAQTAKTWARFCQRSLFESTRRRWVSLTSAVVRRV